ncbi:RNA-directed RNA polymerase [ssRNA phage Zoerhiza.4_26]|uniref:RNA-directed RNA polymerase n=2 Tax=Leviviricetes TaxID=2842243 RepID=A0A8S5KYB4_9VIRU|nr:RNA-directed RNA polymerase [ssRNA phage Zoerhiza.4_26]QDH90890.1 MAG: RNA-dependent RNA polymerase [Leviviridae sp.]DAD50296.1 TPA_asm: RNA-directed RNA polymerase [ssRNA phage Zoerhiza.4_26]
MGNRKSQVDISFYVDLLRNVLADAYACYPGIPSRELDRDMVTIRTRVANEGFEFLTKTLPILGKALDSALETGQLIVPRQFARKSKSGEHWNIPKIFSALFLTIFDRQGHLVHDTNTAVGMIRQLCFVCYKVEHPYTDEQVDTCLSNFKDVDLNLFSAAMPLDEFEQGILSRARVLLRRLFSGFDPSDIVPHHGPGAVADRLSGRRKYDVHFYSREIDQLYPYVVFSTFGIHTQTYDDLLFHTRLTGVQPPARVVCVPKDSRGPRIISCEPALLQFLQQGLSRRICRLVEEHALTKGSVFFTNQQRHRDLALSSSRDGIFATLDMSDASDRVSVDLVKALFPERLVPYLLGTRSDSTRLPSGELIRLNKFAPMGSALCFPIEALTFWALSSAVVWAVSRRQGRLRFPIFVFGDDIIAPTKYAEKIISVLERFSLKFNRGKCFMRGKFRESCGCDAFNGEDVTPVKIRVLRTQVRTRVIKDVYRLSRNAQTFFDHGYWKTAAYLWNYCESIVGLLPTTSDRFSGISRSSTILPCEHPLPMGAVTRWNMDLQRLEVRSYTLRSRKVESTFSRDVLRLAHDLIEGLHEPFTEYVAVPHSALPKAGWFALL